VLGEDRGVFDLIKMRDGRDSEIAEKIARPQMAGQAALHTVQAVNAHNLLSIPSAKTPLHRAAIHSISQKAFVIGAGPNRSVAKVETNTLHAENQCLRSDLVSISAQFESERRPIRRTSGKAAVIWAAAHVKDTKPRYTSRVKIWAPRFKTGINNHSL
jgi:hypothetical protein